MERKSLKNLIALILFGIGVYFVIGGISFILSPEKMERISLETKIEETIENVKKEESMENKFSILQDSGFGGAGAGGIASVQKNRNMQDFIETVQKERKKDPEKEVSFSVEKLKAENGSTGYNNAIIKTYWISSDIFLIEHKKEYFCSIGSQIKNYDAENMYCESNKNQKFFIGSCIVIFGIFLCIISLLLIVVK